MTSNDEMGLIEILKSPLPITAGGVLLDEALRTILPSL